MLQAIFRAASTLSAALVAITAVTAVAPSALANTPAFLVYSPETAAHVVPARHLRRGQVFIGPRQGHFARSRAFTSRGFHHFNRHHFGPRVHRDFRFNRSFDRRFRANRSFNRGFRANRSFNRGFRGGFDRGFTSRRFRSFHRGNFRRFH